MKNKIQKGCFGYLSYKKKFSTIMTIGMFALSLAIYLMGYITTKSNANLLTVVAVLGCLPASKSAVSMIMYLKAKGASKEDKTVIVTNEDGDYDEIALFPQAEIYKRENKISSEELNSKYLDKTIFVFTVKKDGIDTDRGYKLQIVED